MGGSMHNDVTWQAVFERAPQRLVLIDGCVSPESSTLTYQQTANEIILDLNHNGTFFIVHDTFHADTLPRVATVQVRVLAGVQVELIELNKGSVLEAYQAISHLKLHCEPHARVNYYKIQQDSLDALHEATLTVQQEKNSYFSATHVQLGGAQVKQSIEINLVDTGAEVILNGLCLGHAKQQIYTHTEIHHRAMHCRSQEIYKSMAAQKATVIFQGKIIVHAGAQKTVSEQSTKNLLLSSSAQIQAKPELEIYADDVKCTHGATVGMLNADALFYLQSRGIPLTEAKSLLIDAFAQDRLESLKNTVIHDLVMPWVWQKLEEMVHEFLA